MYAWLLEIVVLTFTIIVWILQYNRMVPLKMPEPEPPGDIEKSNLDVRETNAMSDFSRT